MVFRVFVQFGVGFFDPFVCPFVGGWAMGFFFFAGHYGGYVFRVLHRFGLVVYAVVGVCLVAFRGSVVFGY